MLSKGFRSLFAHHSVYLFSDSLVFPNQRASKDHRSKTMPHILALFLLQRKSLPAHDRATTLNKNNLSLPWLCTPSFSALSIIRCVLSSAPSWSRRAATKVFVPCSGFASFGIFTFFLCLNG